MIVAIVTLDHRARGLLTPEQTREIADLFPDYSDADAMAGRDVASSWNAVLAETATFPSMAFCQLECGARDCVNAIFPYTRG